MTEHAFSAPRPPRRSSPISVRPTLQAPTPLTTILAGMKVAFTLAVVGAIVGEFIGANVGLGYLPFVASAVIDTKLLFAALVMISLLAMVAYWVVAFAERMLIPWHISVRRDPALTASL